uniref:DUF4604 domain-containing protein n=1 Tax=Glossina pallidipes TaxID=7398 RepID=A0A1B0AG15_GLOPL
MSKRNVTYLKPQDPSFLAKLKQQIGYKEGPTIETKRQKLDDLASESDSKEYRPEREDEKPQIVVLQSGDLTAEEVAVEEERLAKELAEAPADLSQPITFRRRKPKENCNTKSEASSVCSKQQSSEAKSTVKKSKKSSNTGKLSFNVDDEE